MPAPPTWPFWTHELPRTRPSSSTTIPWPSLSEDVQPSTLPPTLPTIPFALFATDVQFVHERRIQAREDLLAVEDSVVVGVSLAIEQPISEGIGLVRVEAQIELNHIRNAIIIAVIRKIEHGEGPFKRFRQCVSRQIRHSC